jgi:predicted hydrolase (HD superfamily)
MISKEEAFRLIKGTSKFSHARAVAQIMHILAIRLGADETKWELVGLLHDLDYDLVKDDLSQHGIRASGQLKGKLPKDSLYAIKSHDYRTEFKPQSKLDKALSIVDVIVWVCEKGDSKISTIEDLNSAIETMSTIAPWLKENLLRCEEIGITKTELLKIAEETLKEIYDSVGVKKLV